MVGMPVCQKQHNRFAALAKSIDQIVVRTKIVLALRLEFDPRDVEANCTSSNFSDKPNIDSIGITPSVGVYAELRKFLAFTLPLQLEQWLPEMTRGRNRPTFKDDPSNHQKEYYQGAPQLPQVM
jgi:hypothetical protein